MNQIHGKMLANVAKMKTSKIVQNTHSSVLLKILKGKKYRLITVKSTRTVKNVEHKVQAEK